jgi:hypothetical protein
MDNRLCIFAGIEKGSNQGMGGVVFGRIKNLTHQFVFAWAK